MEITKETRHPVRLLALSPMSLFWPGTTASVTRSERRAEGRTVEMCPSFGVTYNDVPHVLVLKGPK